MTEKENSNIESKLSVTLDWVVMALQINADVAVQTLDLAFDVYSLKQSELSKLPFHLNILDTFTDGKLRETAHSRFLWKLLLLPEMMDGFKKRFFPKCNLSLTDCKVNYPDKHRIDISIEGKTDFFIIENKINDATEQCGQIYRYVHHALKSYRADKIHVLYLNSQTHDLPSSYSLTKDGKGCNSVPDAVDLQVISYKDEITDWLEAVYPSIPDSEPYLKSAIFQYIDYLKEHFNTSTRHKNMNHKIQSLINDRLFSEDMTTVEKMKVITDAKHQLDELKSQLEAIEKKQIAIRFQEWFDAITEKYPLDEYDWKRDGETDIHLEFKYRGHLVAAYLTIDEGLCWGIGCVKKEISEKLRKEIQAEVQLFLPKAQSTSWWPAWDFTSYENGLNRYLTLLECVFKIEDPPE